MGRVLATSRRVRGRGVARACALSAIALTAACSKRSADGLPPASDWTPGSGSAAAPELPRVAPPPGMMGGADRGTANPHAGLAMGGSDPHAGLAMGGDDPHAGLAMGGDDPHAGLDLGGGGADVTKLGLEAPDPNRRIDPSHSITGIITVDAKTRDRARPGGVIFLVVKRAGADGAPSGPSLAVDKLDWSRDGIAFELTDANAMAAGTELSGDVVVMARYDQDADALSKQPGDLLGQQRVKVPAVNVKLVLDTVLP